MWTYLALLVSASAIVIVFIRRFVLQILVARRPQIEEKVENVLEEDVVVKKKVRVSRDDKAQIEELCEKAGMMIKAGQDDDAIKLFVQALAINDQHKDALHKLAMLYMAKQMFSPASALFKQLAMLSNDPLHYSHLGVSFYHQNLLEEAKQAYQKAVSLDESRAQRFVSLCQVYRSLERPDAAVIALTKAIELEKENVVFMILMADLKSELGDRSAARGILQRVLVLDPENEEADLLMKEVLAFSVGASRTD